MTFFFIIHCPLSIVHYPLSIVHYPLSIIHCPLSIVHCQLKNMYKIIIIVHVSTSIISLLAALFVCRNSFIGILKEKVYTVFYRKTEIIFLVSMYLQLTLGVILYFFLRPENNPRIVTIDDAYRFSSMRFWAIEHFSVMLFALLLIQIGKIFTTKLPRDRDKFRYAGIYYGFSTLLILISTGIFIMVRFI